MEKFFKSILFSVGLYCLLTLPHFIFMYTFGSSGIQYSIEVTMLIGLISGFCGPSLSKLKIFN